jgi:hypothetical protein
MAALEAERVDEVPAGGNDSVLHVAIA